MLRYVRPIRKARDYRSEPVFTRGLDVYLVGACHVQRGRFLGGVVLLKSPVASRTNDVAPLRERVDVRPSLITLCAQAVMVCIRQ